MDIRKIIIENLQMPENFVEDFVSIGNLKSLGKESFFISAGEIPQKMAFVISGLFRYVYVDQKGHEYTKGIIPEYRFISSYSAMISQTPSYFYIEALEDSEILEFQYTDWQQLLNSHPFWLKFLLKFVEQGFSIKEKRERDLLLLDAETRYHNFRKEFPGMEQRIKQGIVASYLGIKPETLSRIRKKITF